MTFSKIILLIFLIILLDACATVKPLKFEPDVRTDTFSSAVSFSLQTNDQALAGSGFLVYQRPDMLHLVVLAPFGSTLLEIYVRGSNLAFVYPSQSVAFLGTFDELPEKKGIQAIRMIRWVMDLEFKAPNGKTYGSLEQQSRLGFKEKLSFENGLLVSRESENGDKVYFAKYSVVNGVPFAHEIDMRDTHGNQLLLSFDEPDVNGTLEDKAIIPRLDNMSLYPLSALNSLI